jgi:type 1 fimbriae regulatory protein FimB/type 1 fimbriae regulatory protein FimE
MDIGEIKELTGGAVPSFRRSDRPQPPIKQHDTRARSYLTESEVEATIKTCGGRLGKRDAALILITYRHGLRANEVCNLPWASIVLDGKQTSIAIKRSKGGVNTIHPLRGPEIRALHAWQNLQGGRSPYVFTSLRGGPLVERSVHAIVQGAGAAAGLPFAAIHTCCATHAGLSSPKTVKIRAPSRATLATARSI